MENSARRNAEVVRALYTAPDVDAALALVDADCEWIESEVPEMPFSGEHHGVEALRENIYARVPEFFEEFALQPEQVLEAGDDVVLATGRVRAKTRAGRRLDAPFAHVFTLHDGTIRRCVNYHDSALWLQALATPPERARSS